MGTTARVGLSELARRIGTTRARLLTMLQALEDSSPRLRGKVIVHVGPRSRVYVSARVAKRLVDEQNAMARTVRDIAHLEQDSRLLELRMDAVERAMHAKEAK